MDWVCQALCIVNVIWKWNYEHLKTFAISVYINQQVKGNLWKSMFKCNSEFCCCVQIVSWKEKKITLSVLLWKETQFFFENVVLFYSKIELPELIVLLLHGDRRYHPLCGALSCGKNTPRVHPVSTRKRNMVVLSRTCSDYHK